MSNKNKIVIVGILMIFINLCLIIYSFLPKIELEINGDKLKVTVLDSSNNKTEGTKKVNYIDNEKPTIALNGAQIIYLNKNEKYKEEGATAYDSCDGDLSDEIKISDNIDYSKPGQYKIIYKVKDSFDNEEKIERDVIIVDPENLAEDNYYVVNDATIYLTFDDGPYKYTEEILEVLEKYDIKATFFVTNQFPKYNYIIKKEYEKGHSIGIHTYSHKWSIYESVDTYLEDFNKMDEIVYNEIGIHTKIFRFPGGSSNRISKNYNKGIMTELAEYMTDQGYVYFDWNVDSGDTNKKDRSTEKIIKNVKESLKGDGDYVILMHDIKKNTLEALPEIIEYALERGYKFSALDENSSEIHFKIAN